MVWSLEDIDKAFNRICDFISEGNSLNSALELHDTPAKDTFYKWIDHKLLKEPTEEQIYLCNKRFDQYARAKENRSTVIFEEILEIADRNDFDVIVDDEGKWRVNGEVVQRARLQIDARKWMLGKMQPKKYGDKIDVTTGGEKIQPQKGMNVTLPDGTNIDDFISRVKK